MSHPQPHRRALLATLAAGASGFAAWQSGLESPAKSGMARIAISLDLEMSRNFPRWEDTHWDYEKGNLDETSKRCTTAVCDMVRSAGGVAHLFVLGRMFEQADVDWLLRLVRQGHPVGNHTYDHVNITGRRLEELQYRFNRAPWLVQVTWTCPAYGLVAIPVQPRPLAGGGEDTRTGDSRQYPPDDRCY